MFMTALMSYLSPPYISSILSASGHSPFISLDPQSGHFREAPLGSTFPIGMPLSEHFSSIASPFS